MATHKDALKRHRQSEKNNLRNRFYKVTLRTLTKKFRAALDNNLSQEEVAVLLSQNIKHIQKTSQKGIIHKNQADRRVSRMQLAFNKAFPA